MDAVPAWLRQTDARASLRRRALPLGALTLLGVIILGACTGDETSPPAVASAVAPSPALAAETATPTPRPGPTATPWAAGTPAPPPTPAPVPSQFTVHLIDIAAGEVDRLYNSDRQSFPVPEFTPDGRGVWVHDVRERRTELFALDGALQATPSPGDSGASQRCAPTDEDGVVVVDGQRVEARCGLFSPSGDAMAFTVTAGDTYAVTEQYRVPLYDQWLLDVETGQRRLLQESLRHCGGCDSRAGPAWSPSGRYLMFSELLDAGRTFESDTLSGTTRVVASGRTESGHALNGIGRNPTWSPTSDMLLLPGPNGGSIAEHFPDGEVLDLPDVEWPAAFSDDGRYIVSPRTWRAPSNDTAPGPSKTVVIDSASGRAVAVLDGARPASLLWIDFRVMVAFGGEPVALLEGAAQCSRGTTVLHHPLAPGGAICLDGAIGATLSPHGDRVAFGRNGGDGREVVVLDVASGEEQAFALPSFVNAAASALIRWNDAGTHLLVTWPVFFGP